MRNFGKSGCAVYAHWPFYHGTFLEIYSLSELDGYRIINLQSTKFKYTTKMKIRHIEHHFFILSSII